MKKLVGLKKEFSSLENQQLTNLEAVMGGGYYITSNFVNEQGCQDSDYYTSDGGYIGRDWLCGEVVTPLA